MPSHKELTLLINLITKYFLGLKFLNPPGIEICSTPIHPWTLRVPGINRTKNAGAEPKKAKHEALGTSVKHITKGSQRQGEHGVRGPTNIIAEHLSRAARVLLGWAGLQIRVRPEWSHNSCTLAEAALIAQ